MHEWQTIHSAKIYRELYIGNEICAVIPQTAITAGGGVPEITSQYISHPMNLIFRPDDHVSARHLSIQSILRARRQQQMLKFVGDIQIEKT
jgi:hypothetical protein